MQAEKAKSQKQRIKDILRTADGHKHDISRQIYSIIESAVGSEPELLQFFFEQSEMIESDKSIPISHFSSPSERMKLEADFGSVINASLETIIKKRLPNRGFYKELWAYLSGDIVLGDRNSRIFALYCMWIDARTPYFELEPGVKFSHEKYCFICEKISHKIMRARFILHFPAEQRTEQASRLLNMIKTFEEDEEAIVFLSQVIGMTSEETFLSKWLGKQIPNL